MRDCPVCGADVAEGVCDFGHAVEPAADDISVRDKAIAATLEAVHEEYLQGTSVYGWMGSEALVTLLRKAKARLI